MIPNPTSKGKTSEAIILAALVPLGKSVLIPWGEERYDMAVDDGQRFMRIQCKAGILRNGCVQVRNIRWARDYELPVPQMELIDLRGLNGEAVDGDLVAVAAY